MDEIWKSIDGSIGYEISSFGNIRSIARKVNGRYGLIHKKGCNLKTWLCRHTGYKESEPYIEEAIKVFVNWRQYRIDQPGERMIVLLSTNKSPERF